MAQCFVDEIYNEVVRVLNKAAQLFVPQKQWKQCKAVYRRLLREEEKREVLSYSNDLHEALLKKNGKRFWNCWQAKFESSTPCSQVDGSVDDNAVTNKFANHFQKLYTCNIKSRADELHDQFTHLCSGYVGDCLSASHVFDTELVSKVVSELHLGKAPDIVGLTGEHFVAGTSSWLTYLCMFGR